MSDKEIQRLAVLQDVRDQRITQVRAAEILNLSTRQITRLLQKLNQAGVSGLAHASRGQPGLVIGVTLSHFKKVSGK